jgi:hypothetical protein
MLTEEMEKQMRLMIIDHLLNNNQVLKLVEKVVEVKEHVILLEHEHYVE